MQLCISNIESRKNGPRGKNPGKMVPGKNGSRKKWLTENWSPEKWSPENSETKNRGVSVEHRGVCMECLDVINILKPKTRPFFRRFFSRGPFLRVP